MVDIIIGIPVMKELDLIYAMFKNMEQSYHTWMNYHSLFNGALLVAYCTIITSIALFVNNNPCVNVICNFECDLLSGIALLGIIASYCWYLSMMGHDNWLDNWRRKMQEYVSVNFYSKNNYQIMTDISCEDFTSNTMVNICGKKRLMGFYSTYKITKIFISAIIIAWSIVFFYTLSMGIVYEEKLLHNIEIGILLSLLLYILSFLLYPIFGSELKNFTINTKNNKGAFCPLCKIIKIYFISENCNIIIVAVAFILYAVLLLWLLYNNCEYICCLIRQYFS